MKKEKQKKLNSIKNLLEEKIKNIIEMSDDYDQESISNIMETLISELKILGYQINNIDTKGYWKNEGDVSYLTDNLEKISIDEFNFQLSFNQNKVIVDGDDFLYQYTILNSIIEESELKPIIEYSTEADGYLFSFLSNGNVILTNEKENFEETFVNLTYAIKHLLK